MVAYMHIRFGFWLETLIPDLCWGMRPHQNGAAQPTEYFPTLFSSYLYVLIIPTTRK